MKEYKEKLVFFSEYLGDLIDSSINFANYIHKYNKPEKRIKTINKLLDKCVKINMKYL